MNVKEEKNNRIKYLKEAYKVAFEYSPSSPFSVCINPRELGKQLGFDETTTERIAIWHVDNNYATSSLGLGVFMVTPTGLDFLESLEDEIKSPFNLSVINTGDIHAPVQFQQNSSNSQQTQRISYTSENVTELFRLLRIDIEQFDKQLKEDFNSEINYALKQLDKGKDIKSQLLNIGSLITNIGLPFFVNLVSSGVFEILKPALGL